jgi:hypothetical protein
MKKLIKILKSSIIFRKKKVALGEGHVEQFIIFENKHLFSIILYKWFTIDQIRFHTHAFSAVAFLLKGWYWEKILFKDIEMPNFVNVPFLPRFLPKNYCHAIQQAKPGTRTLVITGPWQKHWYEYFPDTKTWVKYHWGREKVEKLTELPKELLE